MEPVKAGSQEFQTLEAYARDTHGSTHSHFQVSILNAFRVERPVFRFIPISPISHGPVTEMAKRMLGPTPGTVGSATASAYSCGMVQGQPILQV
jgi:hypothetical protein